MRSILNFFASFGRMKVWLTSLRTWMFHRSSLSCISSSILRSLLIWKVILMNGWLATWVYQPFPAKINEATINRLETTE